MWEFSECDLKDPRVLSIGLGGRKEGESKSHSLIVVHWLGCPKVLYFSDGAVDVLVSAVLWMNNVLSEKKF